MNASAPRERRVRRLGAAGAAGALAFLGVQVAMHLLRADLSPIRDYVSDYANGPYGSLFAASALVHGAGNLALAVGLWLAFADTRAGRWGVGLFAVAALGMLVGGAFPTDPAGVSPTTVGMIHRIAASASFLLELVALLLLTAALRGYPAWRSHRSLTRSSSIAAAIALGWLVAAIAAGWPPGLPERVTLAVFLA